MHCVHATSNVLHVWVYRVHLDIYTINNIDLRYNIYDVVQTIIVYMQITPIVLQMLQETEYSKHGVSSDGRRGVSSVDSERGVSSDSGHGISLDSERGFFSGIRRGIRKLFGAAKEATVSVVKKALRVFNLDIKIDRKYKKRFDKYTNREQTRWWFEVWGDESALKALESKWEEVYAQHKWRLETCPTVPKRS